MIWIDIIVLVITFWLAYKGFKKGIVIEIASLIALIFGIYGAINFSGLLNEHLIPIGISEKYLPIVSFVATFILIISIIMLLAKFLEKLIDLLSLSFLNRIGGGVFGALKGLLICTVIIVVLNKIDERVNFISDENKSASIFYQPMVDFSQSVFPEIMKEYFPKKNA